MPQPYLSVVIPAYNEDARIASTIKALVDFLSAWSTETGSGTERTWELIVVSDGSTDSTAEIVTGISAADDHVRLIDAPHGGKGAAVRRGMDEAIGEWRFLCDADLSMPADHLGRFFAGKDSTGQYNGQPEYDVAIGSREAPGAKRFNEPRSRHVKGRFFNYAVKILALRGIEDTQCGFKLFSAEAATRLFPHQSLDGWAFDVELLVMAKKAGFTVGEIPIDWYYGEGSKMTLLKGILAVTDVARVGMNNLFGKYKMVERKGEQ